MATSYNSRVADEWKILLDAEADQDELARAWDVLHGYMRVPILLELRRHLEGRRHTEQLASDLCDSVRDGGEAPLLRENVAELLATAVEAEVGGEFDKDWAGSLLLFALKDMGRMHPRDHALLLRVYDRPAGAEPLSSADLAKKLARSPEDMERALAEGRAELKVLFERQIAATVAGPALLADEVERLMPHVTRMFGGAQIAT